MLEYPDWYARALAKVMQTRLGIACVQTYHTPALWQGLKSTLVMLTLGKYMIGREATAERITLTVASITTLYYSNILHAAKTTHAATLAAKMLDGASADVLQQAGPGTYL